VRQLLIESTLLSLDRGRVRRRAGLGFRRFLVNMISAAPGRGRVRF
jgi:hypothetical protein